MILLKRKQITLPTRTIGVLASAAVSRCARMSVLCAGIIAALARLAEQRVPYDVVGRRADW